MHPKNKIQAPKNKSQINNNDQNSNFQTLDPQTKISEDADISLLEGFGHWSLEFEIYL